MRIKITSGGIHGLPTDERPTGEIPIGAIFTVKNLPEGWKGRYEVIDSNQDADLITGSIRLEARETGAGWWAIFNGAGAIIGQKIRRDAAEQFNAMTDEEKAEYVSAE